ncbi:Uncharacterised protein [Chlamydia trachomatis]|nr:Uncharacterised protein [Chlamydia trachomatis]
MDIFCLKAKFQTLNGGLVEALQEVVQSWKVVVKTKGKHFPSIFKTSI